MLNMQEKANEIFHSSLDDAQKVKQLEDLIFDCQHELEAQEQNMRPEVQHRLSEGLRIAKNYVRTLQEK